MRLSLMAPSVSARTRRASCASWRKARRHQAPLLASSFFPWPFCQRSIAAPTSRRNTFSGLAFRGSVSAFWAFNSVERLRRLSRSPPSPSWSSKCRKSVSGVTGSWLRVSPEIGFGRDPIFLSVLARNCLKNLTFRLGGRLPTSGERQKRLPWPPGAEGGSRPART